MSRSRTILQIRDIVARRIRRQLGAGWHMDIAPQRGSGLTRFRKGDVLLRVYVTSDAKDRGWLVGIAGDARTYTRSSLDYRGPHWFRRLAQDAVQAAKELMGERA